jgi:hypothetical protein
LRVSGSLSGLSGRSAGSGDQGPCERSRVRDGCDRWADCFQSIPACSTDDSVESLHTNQADRCCRDEAKTSNDRSYKGDYNEGNTAS